MTIENKRSD